ncbi:MAG TPA: hypothetical protein DEB39_11415 [Planctomycetaceae bacterium]|nr:hypothetical protein [Planctomycetaceae bacterium]
MFKTPVTIFHGLLCLLVLSLAGCGGDARPPGFPKLYPVSLKVTQGNVALAGASVKLREANASMTWSIGGMTDEEGIVVLWTHGRFRGAPEGKFKVAVSKLVNEGEEELIAALNREDHAAAKKITVNSYSLVAAEYESFSTTPIEIEITRKTRTLDISAGATVKIRREYLRD